MKHVRIDCTKIITLEEVKLILSSLDLRMSTNCEHYEKLKHLVVENESEETENETINL